MKVNVSNNKSLKFIIIVTLLTVLSIAGLNLPDRISWLENSDILRWAIAILCGLCVSYVLVWLSISSRDSDLINTEESHLRGIKSKGRFDLIQSTMIADLKYVLYFSPLVTLIAGWILGWSVSHIIGVISMITFVTITAAFFRGYFRM